MECAAHVNLDRGALSLLRLSFALFFFKTRLSCLISWSTEHIAYHLMKEEHSISLKTNI